jgi:hypothetical protein
MFQDGGSTIVQKRMSFLSVLVLSVAFVTMAIILSLTGITIYGMRLVDKKTDNLSGLIEQTVRSLPAVKESLPPALADAFEDQRRPDYLQNLVISTKLIGDNADRGWRRCRVVVDVQNKGDETVTLMSMRLVGLDANDEPVMERSTWVATPLQLDCEWRGPLLPHETRHFAVWCHSSEDAVKISHEVSEIRVWLKDDQKSTNSAKQAQEPLSPAAT